MKRSIEKLPRERPTYWSFTNWICVRLKEIPWPRTLVLISNAVKKHGQPEICLTIFRSICIILFVVWKGEGGGKELLICRELTYIHLIFLGERYFEADYRWHAYSSAFLNIAFQNFLCVFLRVIGEQEIYPDGFPKKSHFVLLVLYWTWEDSEFNMIPASCLLIDSWN